MPGFSLHISNPFKSIVKWLKPSSSTKASVHKFMPQAQGTATKNTPPSKTQRHGQKHKTPAASHPVCKPAKGKAPLAKAQQNLSHAIAHQQPVNKADLLTLAQASQTPSTGIAQPAPLGGPLLDAEQAYASALVQPDPYAAYAMEVPMDPPALWFETPQTVSIEEVQELGGEYAYNAALNGIDPAAYGAVLQADEQNEYDPITYATRLEQHILAHEPDATTGAALDAEHQASLSSLAAALTATLNQLAADMESKNETIRKFKRDDGATVSAAFTLDKNDNKTRIFTVQDSVAYESSGEFGDWVSLREGNLRLNRVELADHVQPGPALRTAAEYAVRLLAA